MPAPLHISLGVKSDPIEYRYSFDWLFRVMAEEDVHTLQLGSFFEVYQLADDYFHALREKAASHGIRIASLFTAHRELGGFFQNDPHFEAVARRNYLRYIEVGALLGAAHVGSNPGATLRDRMDGKAEGIACYLRNMKELMAYAREKGVECLTVEPMSCLAEPPTLAEEIAGMMEELAAHHAAHPETTVPAGICGDTSHGYADAARRVRHTHLELFEAAYPWLVEFHIKNTDAVFNSTFGFTPAERERGVVDLRAVRDSLYSRADMLPLSEMTAYLEIGGPKLGRDYSDGALEELLRGSLRHLKEVFAEAPGTNASGGEAPAIAPVKIAPSLMCCDMAQAGDGVRQLEAAGMDLLHIDIMDAHFTPNMPLGFEVLRKLRAMTQLPFDAHLMVDLPDFYIRQMADIGCDYVSIHVESCTHLDRSLALIRDLGMKAGAALNPATPLNVLEFVLDRLDFILLMTVNPGYAGQKLVPSGISKIEMCRAWLNARDCDIPIEVDGNVSVENIPRMVAAGADWLVAGTSSIFHRDGTLPENTRKTKHAILEGLRGRRK